MSIRGFNCTVSCEPFDFSELFARIPLGAQDTDDQDYPEDYDDDDEEEEEENEENDDYSFSENE